MLQKEKLDLLAQRSLRCPRALSCQASFQPTSGLWAPVQCLGRHRLLLSAPPTVRLVLELSYVQRKQKPFNLIFLYWIEVTTHRTL